MARRRHRALFVVASIRHIPGRRRACFWRQAGASGRAEPASLSRSRGHGRRDSAGVRDGPNACGFQRPAPDRQTPLRPRFRMIKHVSARRRRARAPHQHRRGPVRDGHRRPPGSTVAARPASASSGGRRDHCQTGRGPSWSSAAWRSLAPSASITGRAGGRTLSFEPRELAAHKLVRSMPELLARPRRLPRTDTAIRSRASPNPSLRRSLRSPAVSRGRDLKLVRHRSRALRGEVDDRVGKASWIGRGGVIAA